MIAELGHAAVWLALGMALLRVAGPMSSRPGWAATAAPAAMAQAWFLIAAQLALLWCFAVTDLSVALVNDSSHSLKPLAVRLADVARHGGGQMLIGAVIIGVAGGVSAFQGRRGLMFHGLASIILIGATLAANPFARIDTVPAQARAYLDSSPLLFLGLAALALVLLATRSRWVWGAVIVSAAIVGTSAGVDAVRRVKADVRLTVGDQVRVGPLTVRLAELQPVASPGNTAVQALLLVSVNQRIVTSLHPEHRALIYPQAEASPIAIALIKSGALTVRVRRTDVNSAALDLVWHPFLL